MNPPVRRQVDARQQAGAWHTVDTELQLAARLRPAGHSGAIHQLAGRARQGTAAWNPQRPVWVKYPPTPATLAIEATSPTTPAPPAWRPLPAAIQDVESQPSHALGSWPRSPPTPRAPCL